MTSFDQTPDAPQPFGYKTLWFALKTSDPALVVETLNFGEAMPANWASGLAAADSHDGSQTSDPWVFMSPPVNGWVLVTSASFPYPVTIDAHQDIGRKFDILFSRLMERFDEVQFFGSQRGVGFVTWARACGGEPKRIFGFADGDVLANVGEQTAEEAQLGFVNLSGLSPHEACDKIFAAAEDGDIEEQRLIESGVSPRDARASVRENSRDPIPDESDVIDLAALWSIDPAQVSDQDHPPGLGFALRLPTDFNISGASELTSDQDEDSALPEEFGVMPPSLPAPAMTATCACGSVELSAFGRPIMSAVCYCDDCQKGGEQIESLAGAGPVRDPDGGTAYILYRKDRIKCARGAELLKPYKLKETSITNRVVAACCNSAMFVNFDRGPFWISAYRARFHGELPPLQARVCTKFKPNGVVLPDDVPSYPRYSPGLMFRLLAARMAMFLGR